MARGSSAMPSVIPDRITPSSPFYSCDVGVSAARSLFLIHLTLRSIPQMETLDFLK
jgi:hypothetical protein